MLPLKAWKNGEICWNGHRNLIQMIMKQFQLDIQKLKYFLTWIQAWIFRIWRVFHGFAIFFSQKQRNKNQDLKQKHQPPIHSPLGFHRFFFFQRQQGGAPEAFGDGNPWGSSTLAATTTRLGTTAGSNGRGDTAVVSRGKPLSFWGNHWDILYFLGEIIFIFV